MNEFEVNFLLCKATAIINEVARLHIWVEAPKYQKKIFKLYQNALLCATKASTKCVDLDTRNAEFAHALGICKEVLSLSVDELYTAKMNQVATTDSTRSGHCNPLFSSVEGVGSSETILALTLVTVNNIAVFFQNHGNYSRAPNSKFYLVSGNNLWSNFYKIYATTSTTISLCPLTIALAK